MRQKTPIIGRHQKPHPNNRVPKSPTPQTAITQQAILLPAPFAGGFYDRSGQQRQLQAVICLHQQGGQRQAGAQQPMTGHPLAG